MRRLTSILVAVATVLSLAACSQNAVAAPLHIGDTAPAVAVWSPAHADTIVTGTGYIRITGGAVGVQACDLVAWDAAKVWLYAVDKQGKISSWWGPYQVREFNGPRYAQPPGRFDLIGWVATDSLAITVRGN